MIQDGDAIDRTSFLRRTGSLLIVALIDRRSLAPFTLAPARRPHPDPRPGITADHVLPLDALGLLPLDKVVEAYDAARKHPAIFDGLSCACGCSGQHGEHRSLLVCYETKQPTGCVGCQQQAHLAGRLADDGKSLAEIRVAFDKEYG